MQRIPPIWQLVIRLLLLNRLEELVGLLVLDHVRDSVLIAPSRVEDAGRLVRRNALIEHPEEEVLRVLEAVQHGLRCRLS